MCTDFYTDKAVVQEFTGTLLRILNILHAKLTLNMYVFTGIDEDFYLTVT